MIFYTLLCIEPAGMRPRDENGQANNSDHRDSFPSGLYNGRAGFYSANARVAILEATTRPMVAQ